MNWKDIARNWKDPITPELRQSEVGVPAAKLADAPPGTAWATETQTCIALGIDSRTLYDDAEMIGGCRYSHALGEILFDAGDVARRVQAIESLAREHASKDDPKAKADRLLADLAAQGFDTTPFGGDGPAAA